MLAPSLVKSDASNRGALGAASANVVTLYAADQSSATVPSLYFHANSIG